MESQELPDVLFRPQQNPFLEEEIYYEQYPETESCLGYVAGALIAAAAIGLVVLIFISLKS